MPKRVVVPFAGEEPKSRLEPALRDEERRRLAYAMLADVCEAIRAAGHEPGVLATGALSPPAGLMGVRALTEAVVTVDDRPLSVAVNAVLERALPSTGVNTGHEGVAIVMADLALATPDALADLFGTPGEVVVAPGRGGGTNALVVREPAFRVDYHGASYLDHRQVAADCEASWSVVDSFRLATDIDEPADLVECWLHGGERSRAALESFGFGLETTDGRVRLER